MKTLPKNDLPTFTTKLPSTEQEVVYRPMKVREQRNLMTALDGSMEEIYRVVKICVNECTFGSLPIDDLPNFDVEYLFMQIRIMSIGENLKVDVTCPDCGFIETKEISLSTTKIENLGNKTNLIKLSDSLMLEMRYPSIVEIGKIEDSPDSDTVFSIVRNCIQKIYSDNEITNKEDIDDNELMTWLGDCSDEQFQKLEDFIVKSPYLVASTENECGRCKTKTNFFLKGIKSFFA